MTLDELKAKFTGLMNRRDLTANTALVGDFIDQALMRVQRELRVPAMEKVQDVTIASPYRGLGIPRDFLELISIIPQATFYRRLSMGLIENVLNLSLTTGCPEAYVRQANVWVLGPSPQIGDVIRIHYYAEPAPLVNGSDTNILTMIAWDLIVYAALASACEYFKDNRIQAFEARYQQIFGDLQGQADDDELDVSAVQPCWSFPSDLDDDVWVN